ncbi:DivIVA domain-containing protein [Streptomyces sp. P38-E01]|uniref:DivIVA domain-containing protein n=1 Tax=Streptomyces tardus TaxID=2780544 RepID=A0A949N948_9ACTN|nr:DivIVA domain-containing protein [Streptomyces tardus]
MFWFLLLGLLLVIGAVTLAVSGSGVGRGGDRVVGGLADPVPERLAGDLPPDRPVARTDIDTLRLPLALRGYRMEEVDDALDRLGAELSERDARIAELEAALAGAQAGAVGGELPDEPRGTGEVPPPDAESGPQHLSPSTTESRRRPGTDLDAGTDEHGVHDAEPPNGPWAIRDVRDDDVSAAGEGPGAAPRSGGAENR